MKFKLDENLPVELAESLGKAGLDAVTVVAQTWVDAQTETSSQFVALKIVLSSLLMSGLPTFVHTLRNPIPESSFCVWPARTHPICWQ